MRVFEVLFGRTLSVIATKPKHGTYATTDTVLHSIPKYICTKSCKKFKELLGEEKLRYIHSLTSFSQQLGNEGLCLNL